MKVDVMELVAMNLQKAGASCYGSIENFSFGQIDYFYDLMSHSNGWGYIVNDNGSEKLVQVNELVMMEGELDASNRYNIMARIGVEYYIVEDSRIEKWYKDKVVSAIMLLPDNKIKREDEVKNKIITISYIPVAKKDNLPNSHFLK